MGSYCMYMNLYTQACTHTNVVSHGCIRQYTNMPTTSPRHPSGMCYVLKCEWFLLYPAVSPGCVQTN